MARTDDAIKLAFEHGVNVRTRTIFLSGEIDSDKAHNIQIACSFLDCEGSSITVRINSHGGTDYDGFAIYDALRNCRAHVITVGAGQDRKSTRLNSSHLKLSRMPSSA